ncbi:MAG TPA: hypothetical protein VJ180_12860 [Pyrinomonadaceae bacterium]|nr:hypothetical protein [Pyrinomonadaceae bacterium]
MPMNQAEGNPPSNQLGTGLNEQQVKEAVEASGYPLQLWVGDIFRNHAPIGEEIFQVQDEWCFIDRDTKELRNIDLRCDLRLHQWEPQPRVRPKLSVLIECKQSDLPYIFFQSRTKPWLSRFPQISGLHTDKVIIISDDDPSSWTYSINHSLGLDRDSFQESPPYCHTFSKCVRKGPKVELSGADAYSSLVLPLIKALDHFAAAESPPETAWYFDCHATLGLGVIDAPMIGVTVNQAGHQLTARPWMRLVRHEYQSTAERFERDRLCVLDIVHKDFLNTYLDDHLLPFAQRFSESVEASNRISNGGSVCLGDGRPWS